MTHLSIDLAGETLTLDARRAIHWPARQCLLIADLHLGKASLLRQAGAALPRGTTTRDLDRLGELVADYQPQRLIVLGDLVHGAEPRAADWLHSVAAWRERHPLLAITLVAGNHDRHYALPDIDKVAELDTGPFLLRHAPATRKDRHVLAGHLHPGARYRDGRLAQRWPAFWIGSDCSVLPAFGQLTGLAPMEAAAGTRVFAATPGGILDLSGWRAGDRGARRR